MRQVKLKWTACKHCNFYHQPSDECKIPKKVKRKIKKLIPLIDKQLKKHGSSP